MRPEYDLAASTVQYRKKRELVLMVISGSKNPCCERCGSSEKLQFHHVKKDDGHEPTIGGKTHLYRVIEDYENGVTVQVVCESCHKMIHDIPKDKEYRGAA